jgi:hypothetical protein
VDARVGNRQFDRQGAETVLAMTNYSQEYIDVCRGQIDAQVATYTVLVTAGADLRGSSKTQLDSAIYAFEPVFFNNIGPGPGELLRAPAEGQREEGRQSSQ